MLPALKVCMFGCDQALGLRPWHVAAASSSWSAFNWRANMLHTPGDGKWNVHVAMIALEEKVEQVSPRSVSWNELHDVHQHRCIALIEHHKQMIKDHALALAP